ncbi:PadR family transcriptional regulator [Clostridium magnum]|uniref:Transcriptional regulator YqjI n=1 Tax=Clostridium magnum DSM 2767 TaxID=1121326 RepID=A0A162RS67_9CLOT|nr:PadR family transcriptional regulator [Clostridium magnum]KZL90304.1 transcriptional regulator YqjI [Clostridium magnum DSM 2767]SHH81643.1 Transcriptional regulator PadR-like family protein [Clostridium magnum DSM 2767]
MISKDLIAASSRPLILSLLSKKESYGYEIIKNIQELSDSNIIWKDGMLYPVLKKLCENGLVESEWKTIDGRKRKYYKITALGLEALRTEKSQWKIVNTTLNNIWGCSLCSD